MAYVGSVQMFQAALDAVQDKFSCPVPISMGSIPESADALALVRYEWREDLDAHMAMEIIVSDLFVKSCFNVGGDFGFTGLKSVIFGTFYSASVFNKEGRMKRHYGEDFVEIDYFKDYESVSKDHPDVLPPIPSPHDGF